MEYKIEVLNKNDIRLYKELIDECFGGSNDLDHYKKYALNKEYVIWVIKAEDGIVGSVTQYAINLFTFGFQPCLMLFNVAVKKDFQRNGIARQLLMYVINNAKSDGYKSISLTCLEDAYPAHKLYESVGFHRSNSLKYTMDL